MGFVNTNFIGIANLVIYMCFTAFFSILTLFNH